MRRGKNKWSCYFIVIGFMYTGVFAISYETPFVNRFGQTGLYSCYSAKTLGMGRLALGMYGNASRHKDFIIAVYDDSDTVKNPDYLISNLNFFLGYGITRYLDVAFMLPYYVDYISKIGTLGGQVIGRHGDLEITLKFQYPPYPHRNFFDMAYFGSLSLPTAERISPETSGRRPAYFPRHTYYFYKKEVSDSSELKYFYTSGSPEVDMKMIWTFDFNELSSAVPVQAHVNYGVRWTPVDLDHLFLLNIGLSFQPVTWFTVFTEFSGETRIANIDKGFKLGNDPLRLSPGVIITPLGGLFLNVGMDISLSSQSRDLSLFYSSDGKRINTHIEPLFRFAATVGWAGFILPQDKDKDGIKDKEDRCPKDPEDFDGYEDEDGCPEYDNDTDGIPDSVDRCPQDKEDLDGFKDEDGCPDYDNDKDGVQDIDDKCPMIPEDNDGFEDEDGCPDIDNDGDGIMDSVDKCVEMPEDRDSHEDEDGCPDYDNDLDGIPDSVDECPNESEIYNTFEDEDGCADTKPEGKPQPKEIKRGRVILRGVNFEFGQAVLTGDSYVILDQVYASLIEWPEIKVEIRGHTDSIGSRLANKRLSYKRAVAVRDYLLRKGIAPDRLIAVGTGEEEPIADNNTAEGRALNRRVELHRID